MLSRAMLALALSLAVAVPATAQRVTLTPSLLVGRWGDNGDCTQPVVFRADGTFRTSEGGVGQWSLRGDQLTMRGNRGTTVLRVTAIGRSRLLIVNPDGSRGTSQRCPAG